MAPIIWSPSLELGVDSLDAQHRGLIQAFNTLLAQRRALGDACSAPVIADRLRAFADEHFTQEEGYMRSFGYPDAEAHLREHAEFLAAVARMDANGTNEADGANANRPAARAQNAEEALGFLEAWIRGHLAGADRRLGHYLTDCLR